MEKVECWKLAFQFVLSLTCLYPYPLSPYVISKLEGETREGGVSSGVGSSGRRSSISAESSDLAEDLRARIQSVHSTEFSALLT